MKHIKHDKNMLEKSIADLVTQYFEHTSQHHNDNNGNNAGGFLHSELIRRVEKELIIQVLKQTEQNQSQTAKILGMSRTTLRKKMTECGLL